jgi:hypothetical protein
VMASSIRLRRFGTPRRPGPGPRPAGPPACGPVGANGVGPRKEGLPCPG